MHSKRSPPSGGKRNIRLKGFLDKEKRDWTYHNTSACTDEKHGTDCAEVGFFVYSVLGVAFKEYVRDSETYYRNDDVEESTYRAAQTNCWVSA
jgi:hypothetical protein